VEGPLFFGAITAFERALNSIHKDPKYLIIRFGAVPFVDLTKQAIPYRVKISHVLLYVMHFQISDTSDDGPKYQESRTYTFHDEYHN
jgi:MFS superfamily sulfate permease-like transporter